MKNKKFMKPDEFYENWEDYKTLVKKKLAKLIEDDLLISKDKEEEILKLVRSKFQKGTTNSIH